MNSEELKRLLDAIIETNYQVTTLYQIDSRRPQPGDPASAEDLARLDIHLAKLGFRAPESYRQALSIYNGIDGFMEMENKYSLLSVDAVIDQDYELLPEMVESNPSSTRFVICAGNTTDCIGFDTATPTSGGGYELVSLVGDGSTKRFDNFEDFLRRRLEGLKKSIEIKMNTRDKLLGVRPRKKVVKKPANKKKTKFWASKKDSKPAPKKSARPSKRVKASKKIRKPKTRRRAK